MYPILNGDERANVDRPTTRLSARKTAAQLKTVRGHHDEVDQIQSYKEPEGERREQPPEDRSSESVKEFSNSGAE